MILTCFILNLSQITQTRINLAILFIEFVKPALGVPITSDGPKKGQGVPLCHHHTTDTRDAVSSSGRGIPRMDHINIVIINRLLPRGAPYFFGMCKHLKKGHDFLEVQLFSFLESFFQMTTPAVARLYMPDNG